VIGILSAIATPTLSRTRMAANEASAIGSLRVIYSGQMAFSVSCGSGNYSPTLQNLAAPVGTAPGYISVDIATAAPVVKSGYELDMASNGAVLPSATSCNGGNLVSTYHTTANPQPGRGVRYFGSNAGGAIFQSSEFLGMPDGGVPGGSWVPIH
jgi:type II secretory pathway pseudopilin PulG